MTERKVVAFFVVIILFFGLYLHKANAVFDCLQLTSNSTADQKLTCQKELNQLLKDEADLEARLKIQSQQTGTLKSDITALTTQINVLKTKIKARGDVIAQLNISINQKKGQINVLLDKIDSEHQSLAQLLRNTNEFDNKDLVDLILSDDSISSFYSDLESYDTIKKSIKNSVEKITGIKVDTEKQKQDLEAQQNMQMDAKAQLEDAQKKVAQSEADKKQLLAISKDKESAYQLLAAQKKARADKIRAALFQLRDTKAIPFGTALEYARLAEKYTNVSAAFVLAIITQESNLGTDSGSCYVTNFDTGAGVSSKSGKVFAKVMKPSRDVDPFRSITASVGRDPAKTLVSCPIGNIGWGGAMGPAQFIPSTWAGIQNNVAAALGISSPDPWEPRDALMASAIFLEQLGASDTYSSQIRAACKYYGTGGSSCSYGRQVMGRVSKIQDNIDLISAN